MIRDRLIDTAIRLGIDNQLRSLRAALSPTYRGQRDEKTQLLALLEASLTPTSNCIDIGAYRGRVLQEMVRLAPYGKHIAYEPLPHMYQYLVQRFPGVDVRQAAVSNMPGETTFVYVKNSPGRSGFQERAFREKQQTEQLTVRVEALDERLPEGYVPHFIKIDVEGAERLVFEGAMKLISTHKPIILFEYGKGGADHYATTPAQIYDLLHNQAGLNLFAMEGIGPYSLAQFEDEYEKNERWDFVARP